MGDPQSDLNPFAPPGAAPEPPPRPSSTSPWMWASHGLFGLLLGSVDAALHREPWNAPIHWVTLAEIVVVLPLYFVLCLSLGLELGAFALSIVLVMVALTAGLNLIRYGLTLSIDPDFLVEPLVVLLAYLVVFVGARLLLRLARRLARGGRSPKDG